MPLSEIAPADGWVVDLLRAGRPSRAKAASANPVVELDLPESISRAIDWLTNHAPEAVEGDAGDHTTFKVAARLRDFGLSKERAFEVLAEHWNEAGKAIPPWPADELLEKVENAFRYGSGVWGGMAGVAEFEDTTATEGEVKRRGPQITWSRDASAVALANPVDPLIEGMLARRSLIVMYGTSNVGKTFVALDFAYHIASGQPWQGRETTKGLVVYLACEGGYGVLARGAALHKHYPHDAQLALVPYSLNLRDSRNDMATLLSLVAEAEATAGLKAQMIVIDTLSRALAGGDENGPVDMGAFVKNVDKIREATGAALLVIHHSGKDAARGARGHSLLRAATDTEIEVAEGKIKVTKQRDMEAAQDTSFRLQEVEIGKDPKGRRVTSCVIEIVTGNEFLKIEPNASEREMLDAFEIAAQEKNPDNWQEAIVTTKEWDDTYLEGQKAMSLSPAGPRQRHRLRTSVTRLGHVRRVKRDQWVST